MFYDPQCKPEIKLEPWRKLLLDAADILERRGHAKRTMVNELGGACLYGALYTAAGEDIDVYWKEPFLNDTLRKTIAALGRVTGAIDRGELMTWNDHPDRTKAEVIAALRQAAGV